MASFFQSFRSSSMPKRLLRYALSRLELLDSEALDIDNLDFAIGRNTVFEFRNVGVKLKKLEKLLQFPGSFSLQKARVLLLRVTIPMDFYTSPIMIEIDGVDVRLQVFGGELKSPNPAPKTPDAGAVPNPVDLAESFLATELESERRRLEDALVAETQDLGASVTVSDDGSEDDDSFGTGQPLSLPVFLADFLQGIMDRMQVRIHGVTFQLDLEVPLEIASTQPEPVSVQVSFQELVVEGVTSDAAPGEEEAPAIVHKEGKRLVALKEVRACLVSEANMFSALARSPVLSSPSLASSPSMTRNPPTRQNTSLADSILERSISESRLHAPLESYAEYFSGRDTVAEPETGLQGSVLSNEAGSTLAQNHEDENPPADDAQVIEDDSPATPRASVYHELENMGLEESMLESTIFQDAPISRSLAFEEELPFHSTTDSRFQSALLPSPRPYNAGALAESEIMEQSFHDSQSSQDAEQVEVEDLTQSRLYTREEAESMYMSAFSESGMKSSQISSSEAASPPAVLSEFPLSHEEQLVPQPELASGSEVVPAKLGIISQPDHQQPLFHASPDSSVTSHNTAEVGESGDSGLETKTPSPQPEEARRIMPGGWSEDLDASTDEDEITPAFSRHLVNEDARQQQQSEESTAGNALQDKTWMNPQPTSLDEQLQDDVPTPKGPTHFVKEILSMQSVSIYLPSHHQHIQVHPLSASSAAQSTQFMGTSVYPQAPGAFSIHQPSRSHVRGHTKSTEAQGMEETLEIDMSPITVDFDSSIAFLLAMISKRLLQALDRGETSEPATTQSNGAPSKTQNVKVKFCEVSLNFLTRLDGYASGAAHHLGPSVFESEKDILLSTTVQNLTITMTPTSTNPLEQMSCTATQEDATMIRLELEKFRLGYSDQDILSFDSSRSLSTSIKDAFLPDGYDVAMKIMRTKNDTRTDIETMQLVCNLDLRRLDETFSWFGGLSGFLSMSASVASTHSPPSKQPAAMSQKPRGVRFDTPMDPEDKSAAAENKVNVRVGGVRLDLVGKECSIVGQTSSIRIVSREEGIGVRCGSLRVSGPNVHLSKAGPAIVAEVGALKLNYLSFPQDADLEKLLDLIMPSKVKFDAENDEIMVDTLLRQRKKGSVLRSSIETLNVRIKNMAQLSVLARLGDDLGKLSTIAKYLPEDDRPGLLSLGSVDNVAVSLDFGGKLGHLQANLRELELAQIPLPALVAIAVGHLSVKRNHGEELVGTASTRQLGSVVHGPVVRARMIGGEIEPVVRLILHDITLEYRVPTVMDLLELGADATPQDFEASLAASIADLGEHAQTVFSHPEGLATPDVKEVKPLKLDIGLRDCLIGLNPLNMPSKMTVVLTDTNINAAFPTAEKTLAEVKVNKASVLLIDDLGQFAADSSLHTGRKPSTSTARHVVDMCSKGYVDICYIQSAYAKIKVLPGAALEKQVEINLRDELFVMETCADSTQTLIGLTNALKPPTPPSKENKYRTAVVPVQDLLASISAEAFGRPEGEYDFDQDFAGAQEMAGSGSDLGYASDSPIRVESQFYGTEGDLGEELFDATNLSGELLSTRSSARYDGVGVPGFNQSGTMSEATGSDFGMEDDFQAEDLVKDKVAKVWNSKKNTYDGAPLQLLARSSVRVTVRDVNFIWNLYDGYDWTRTRHVINKALEDVEARALERQSRGSRARIYEEEAEDEEAVGDFLFNSIYISIPANRDPHELTRQINMGLNDNATETETIATSLTATTNRTARPHQHKSRRLKLNRSKHHKVQFELKGIDVDMVVYPPGSGETQSSVDIRVGSLEVFDQVPTSTWKKFATYDRDQGEREIGTSMVHLEILNVKPIPDLAASEIVLRATVMPLRLHVDQDALDFITRFFEFKDEEIPVHASPSDVPFIQRAEVRDIPVKLDFKPKRVDYGGLRSGHTTEFMNFITLEESRLVLRHTIVYGTSGFDRLGKTLNDIWTPDVRNNQLAGVIAGLAPVRSLVNIGSGFKELVEIPVREYRKDGRVVRSISKGAAAFARTTGTEIVKLGAKLAVGTQYALQGVEGLLAERPDKVGAGWEDDDLDEEDKRQISLYADQPMGVVQGLRGGYRSLTRDVNLARDAIIAVPGMVMDSQSPGGAAMAVMKKAPTIIFRPAMGVTKVVGQTLLGATNQLDPENRRRVDEKYKKH